MTGDALLDRFQLPQPQRDIYRIGQYRPVSVRDQIVRASFLVERLWATGRLAADTSLMVIGAGAAGVTVALKAVHFGVQQVVVVDAADRVLSLQARCSTRWLDPAQYDWPARHWDGECWPIAEPAGFAHPTAGQLPPPVTLQADAADEWAARFEAALSVYEAGGHIRFVPDARAVDWSEDPSRTHYVVQFDDPKTGASRGSLSAQVIVFAGGFGRERVSAPVLAPGGAEIPDVRHAGTPFWADDGFEQPNLGCTTLNDGVLVCGGGDGALQDFIRLVSGQPSARAVWKAVEAVTDPARLLRLEKLAEWDRLLQETEQFAPAHGDPCHRLAAVHARYVHEIEQWCRDATAWAQATAALDALIPAARPVDKVFLALKSGHFDGCYPLNRWVALLLLAYLRTRCPPPHQPVLAPVALIGVLGSASGAWTGPLQAVLAHGTACSTRSAGLTAWAGRRSQRPFDAIVIRQGIDPQTLTVRSTRLASQPVPMHLP